MPPRPPALPSRRPPSPVPRHTRQWSPASVSPSAHRLAIGGDGLVPAGSASPRFGPAAASPWRRTDWLSAARPTGPRPLQVELPFVLGHRRLGRPAGEGHVRHARARRSTDTCRWSRRRPPETPLRPWPGCARAATGQAPRPCLRGRPRANGAGSPVAPRSPRRGSAGRGRCRGRAPATGRDRPPGRSWPAPVAAAAPAQQRRHDCQQSEEGKRGE